jgi:hypothetical protein
MFHPKAFIYYYDVRHPELALAEIRYLQANPDRVSTYGRASIFEREPDTGRALFCE